MNAIYMLKKDHDDMKEIFDRYSMLAANNGSRREKMEVMMDACNLIAVHTQLEEIVFYPALQGIAAKATLAEAFVEHDCAKALMQQLEQLGDDETIFDAKFIVLGEQLRRHIEEEEAEIFPKAVNANLDLQAMGKVMLALREELEMAPSFPARPITREAAPSYVS